MEAGMCAIEPAGHRVLIRVEKTERATKSGIIIADSIAEKYDISNEVGEVVAIGRTAFDGFGDWGVCVGDKVLFVRQGGKKVPNFSLTDKAEEDLRIINDEDIVGILRGGY